MLLLMQRTPNQPTFAANPPAATGVPVNVNRSDPLRVSLNELNETDADNVCAAP